MAEPRTPAQTQRFAMQLIALALIASPLLFLGVVLFLRARDSMPEAATTILTPVSGAIGLSALVTGLVSSRLLGAGGRSFAALLRLIIEQMAVTEGAALFACVAHLIEGQAASAVVAVVLVGWMAVMQFPTQARLARWQGSA